MTQLSIIVAMAKNRVIGRGNDLPWHIPEDLKRFKTLTTGKPVIMGRKTFESILARIKKPLPDRKTIIISSDFIYDHADVTVCRNVAEAIEAGKKMTSDEVMIAGGAQIYKQTLSLADRLYITEVDLEPDGDAWFPEIPRDDFLESERGNLMTSASGTAYRFLCFDRR